MKRSYLTIVPALLLLLLAGPALANGGPGTKAVLQANDDITKLLRKQTKPGSAAEKALAKQVAARVGAFLDIDSLGREALKDHWATLSAAQQEQFMDLLRVLIEQNYIKGLRANLDYKVSYLGEKTKSGSVVVATEVETTRKGRPYVVSIDYVMKKDGKQLRAVDVITDGVGLVENYRAQFNKIIAKRGFDGLLKRMSKKAAKLKP